MYSKTLINELMKAKKYNLQKQVAAELGLSRPYISEIYSGQREFTDETATYIAKEVGLDPSEVLLELARARAKSDTTKAVWDKLLKEHRNSLHAASVLGFMFLSNGLYYCA
ncbi:transcriptional regulator [Zobellella endophytica]|uniref:Transcriptional regulator n=1 Tax=Zobellella endophytica TaxID=2116700 RepID=A0A2P7RCE0_9GAMM|nr:helix-turn-helix domain-containing protein [Zobellella endophytica]PSJ47840.1 transcriptional regulator [Zobellella endophytica]